MQLLVWVSQKSAKDNRSHKYQQGCTAVSTTLTVEQNQQLNKVTSS